MTLFYIDDGGRYIGTYELRLHGRLWG